MADETLFGQYLLKKKMITEEQLFSALQEQQRGGNEKIGAILVRKGVMSEEDVARVLAEQIGFPYVNFSKITIDGSTLRAITADVAVKYQVIPFRRERDAVDIAMANPLDIAAIDDLQKILGGKRINPHVASPKALKDVIRHYYGVQKSDIEQERKIGGSAVAQSRTISPAGPGQEEDASRIIEEATRAPVVKVVNEIIERGVASGASDIHFEPQEDKLYCRFRIDGILHEIEPLAKDMQNAVLSRLKIISEMDIAQSRLPQDGRIQMVIADRDIDFRVASFPTIYGEHIALRILDKSRNILKLEELGFDALNLERFQSIVAKPYGIVLVTGPTGSGKTTTLYGVLQKINKVEKNVVALEDPVEYTIPGAHQTRINVKAGLTFASGLRSVLRIDPDIIMIGEIRDKETADIAIQASLTGHLVFSTLHTNDSTSAITRLIDIGVEPYLVASSLIGVLAQRLIRKLCPKCKVGHSVTEAEIRVIKKHLGDKPPQELPKVLYDPEGCKECNLTGYKGRIGIFEFLIPNMHLREMIVKNTPAHQLRDEALKTTGMKLLRYDGMEKALAGVTSLSEVLSITEEV